jgi:ferredoxin
VKGQVPLRVVIDKAKCIGAGQCVLTEPRIFDQDPSGIVELRAEVPPRELEAHARHAAFLCPSSAISIIDE